MKTLSKNDCQQISGAGIWGSDRTWFESPTDGLLIGPVLFGITAFDGVAETIENVIGDEHTYISGAVALPFGVMGAIAGIPMGFMMGFMNKYYY